MKDHLFRGECPDDGRWVYGSLVPHPDGCIPIIITSAYMEDDCTVTFDYEFVVSDTIGQYIGKSDKNGEIIFEGDMIDIPGSNKKGLPGYIGFNPLIGRFELQRDGYNPICVEDIERWGVIVGNIYDTPPSRKKVIKK